MKLNWRQFAGIVDIPEAKSGDYSIQHKYTEEGAKLKVANLRTTFLGGDFPEEIEFPQRVRWHQLFEEGQGVWMTDWPIEQYQMRQSIRGFKGDIIVGGLGLGVVVKMLLKKKDIHEIVVVELSQEVIDLVAPYTARSKKVTVVKADLMEWLKENRTRKYDYAFYDIWQSDGEGTFFNTVVPLRRLTAGLVPGDHVYCWNENVMRGQLWHSIHGRIIMPTVDIWREKGMALTHEQLASAEGDIWQTWTKQFFVDALAKKWDVKAMEKHSGTYISIYGKPGWDIYWKMYVERES